MKVSEVQYLTQKAYLEGKKRKKIITKLTNPVTLFCCTVCVLSSFENLVDAIDSISLIIQTLAFEGTDELRVPFTGTDALSCLLHHSNDIKYGGRRENEEKKLKTFLNYNLLGLRKLILKFSPSEKKSSILKLSRSFKEYAYVKYSRTLIFHLW